MSTDSSGRVIRLELRGRRVSALFLLIIWKQRLSVLVSDPGPEEQEAITLPPNIMSSNVKDEAGNEPAEDGDQRRYAELTTGNGECIIYDRENHGAWIQSTVSMPVAQLD